MKYILLASLTAISIIACSTKQELPAYVQWAVQALDTLDRDAVEIEKLIASWEANPDLDSMDNSNPKYGIAYVALPTLEPFYERVWGINIGMPLHLKSQDELSELLEDYRVKLAIACGSSKPNAQRALADAKEVRP
jgi:hypothetical protein